MPATETEAKTPGHFAAWASLAKAPDAPDAASGHLQFLVESPACKPILETLCKRVTRIDASDGLLRFEFLGKLKSFELILEAPYVKAFDKSVPASVRTICEAHNQMSLRSGARAQLNFFGVTRGKLAPAALDLDMLADIDEALADRFERRELTPIDIISVEDDFVIINPFKKNKDGEPTLLLVSHEGGKPEALFGGSYSVRGVFLRLIAQALDGS